MYCSLVRERESGRGGGKGKERERDRGNCKIHASTCVYTHTHTHTLTHSPSLSSIVMEAVSSSPTLTFGSTSSKMAKNSSVPSAMVSLMIETGTSRTASPPGGKVKVREIPVKSPGSIE